MGLRHKKEWLHAIGFANTLSQLFAFWLAPNCYDRPGCYADIFLWVLTMPRFPGEGRGDGAGGKPQRCHAEHLPSC